MSTKRKKKTTKKQKNKGPSTRYQISVIITENKESVHQTIVLNIFKVPISQLQVLLILIKKDVVPVEIMFICTKFIPSFAF